MKFIFIDGDITWYDIEFKNGEPVEVDDPVLIKKLKGHSHFKKVGARRKKVRVESVKKESVITKFKDMINDGFNRFNRTGS